MAFPQKNYTLGKGTLHFNKFATGTKVGIGQRYIGNTPEIKLTSESESLEHFDSDQGIKQKDDSVLLSLSRTGSFTTDHISPANLALFFLGNESIVTAIAAVGSTSAFTGVQQGFRYQLGVSPSVPAGVRNVTNVVVTVAAVAKTVGTDYTVDAATGGITVVPGGGIANAADMSVVFDVTATTYNRVVSAASAEIEGSLFYKSNNPKGLKFDYFWPYVTLKPDGDFSLKGDDWQQIGFTFQALKLDDNTEVVYINGRPGEGI